MTFFDKIRNATVDALRDELFEVVQKRGVTLDVAIEALAGLCSVTIVAFVTTRRKPIGEAVRLWDRLSNAIRADLVRLSETHKPRGEE